MTETGYLGRLSNEACGRFLEVNLRVNLRVILRSIKVLNSVKQVLNIVKLVLNSVKQVLKLVKTQSNGRVNLPTVNKPVWDPEYGVCSYTPRFSYECPKVTV